MNTNLIETIESCLKRIRNFAKSGFEPAQHIERQLIRCWRIAMEQPTEPQQAPLCMSWFMDEFSNKFGEYPELAGQLREIEEHINFTSARELAMAA